MQLWSLFISTCFGHQYAHHQEYKAANYRIWCAALWQSKNREVWCCGVVGCKFMVCDYMWNKVALGWHVFGFLRPSDWMLSGWGFGAGRSMRVLWFVLWGLPTGECKWRELGQVLVTTTHITTTPNLTVFTLLQCCTPYAVVCRFVLLMMGILMPETCWDE
jgi:hypothetical protein